MERERVVCELEVKSWRSEVWTLCLVCSIVCLRRGGPSSVSYQRISCLDCAQPHWQSSREASSGRADKV